MCYRIDSEVIIANYFAECEEVTELSLSTLMTIKDDVEKKFNESGIFLTVNTSRGSIANAVYSNPKYFTFDYSLSKIKFNNSNINVFYEDLYSIFNSKIDLKIKFQFLKCLEDVLEEYSNSKVSY